MSTTEWHFQFTILALCVSAFGTVARAPIRAIWAAPLVAIVYGLTAEATLWFVTAKVGIETARLLFLPWLLGYFTTLIEMDLLLHSLLGPVRSRFFAHMVLGGSTWHVTRYWVARYMSKRLGAILGYRWSSRIVRLAMLAGMLVVAAEVVPAAAVFWMTVFAVACYPITFGLCSAFVVKSWAYQRRFGDHSQAGFTLD